MDQDSIVVSSLSKSFSFPIKNPSVGWIKNLVENAVNYTLAGGVTVGLSKKGNAILFFVKDTGIGISDEDKPNLFKEGGHGKDSLKVNVHSTGYGLFSVKKIVDAHGGKVWFDTAHGKGNTFFVELPRG